MDQHYNPLNYAPPPIRNPPPPIFGGGYSANNSPIPSNYQSQVYPEYDYDDRGDADGGDAKRRRIARACDMCRKKKIKCDGKMPKCSHCENYKTECIFTQVEKKRQPPKGAKYIEGLENRLGRMESLLRMSGLLAEDDGGKTDLSTLERRLVDKANMSGSLSSPGTPSGRLEESGSAHQTPHTNDISSPRSGAPTPSHLGAPPRGEKEVEALADQMCSLVTNSCGESRYIGSSSGFSIFSPKGIQWVKEKTGDTSFQDMISTAAANDQNWYQWKPEVFGDIFARRTFKPLPPRHEALALLRDFFENFNCMFPLFHEPTFMHLVNKQYSMDPYEGSGWWASLNVALAIAHRLRVMSNVVSQEEDLHAWGYLKNALAVVTELTIRNNDLLSVQALVGMALFMQGTPNPQPSFFLVAAAIRLAHGIGLHKRGTDFNLNEVESEQRKRVFWIAYILDKDICLRSGRPPVQDDDDMNVELPSEDPPDNVGNVPLGDGKGKVNLFRVMAVFATIQSKVYKQLYSVKASRQSDGELLNTIGQLDQELEAWKDSIPIDFRPEHEIKAQHTPLILEVVVLHFAYYNCLTTIHRMSVHHGYWTSRLSNYAIQGLNARPLNPRVFMSAALCVNAARTSISLIRYIPQGDYACVWLILYYPVSALVTLFANILQNPQDARARSDLKLMNSVVQFLSMLCAEGEPNGHVRRMLSVCSEFERISKVALDKAEREMKGRGKRKQMEKEREQDLDKTLEQQQLEQQAPYRKPVQTPSMQANGGTPVNMGTPLSTSRSSIDGGKAYRPVDSVAGYGASSGSPASAAPFANAAPSSQFPGMSGNGGGAGGSDSKLDPSASWLGDMPTTSNAQNANNIFPPPHQNDYSTGPFSQPTDDFGILEYPDLGNTAGDLTMGGSFQQPFVPQDLWQMPMTLEWDWADVGNMGMGGFAFDEPLPQGRNQS